MANAKPPNPSQKDAIVEVPATNLPDLKRPLSTVEGHSRLLR